MPEPTDAELWRSVEHTVRNVLLPVIDDEWARAAAIQLVGLARFAQGRPAGTGARQATELAGALATLATNPIVARHRPATEGISDVLAAVGAVLAAAVGDDGPAGGEVRTVLRPVVVRQLDDELGVTGPLVAYFRGQLDA